MKSSTAHNHQTKFLAQIQDIYSMAMQFHYTHEWILNRLKERVFDQPAYSKVSGYVQSYLSGWLKCKSDSIYRYNLAWTMSVDGKLLTRKEMQELSDNEIRAGWVYKRDYKSPWARCNNELSRHVWMDKNGEALKDKPY